MKLNWVGYYEDYDGYGRFNRRFASALQRVVDVRAYHVGMLATPAWMLAQQNIDWSRLTISCMPPYMLQRVPGRQWLFSMTEGSLIPPDWVESIHNAGVERVIVPCQHNKEAFENSGVTVPVSVVPGGTDPAEFPVLPIREVGKPYTFLTFADRNERKGWYEVWEAFYKAFGGKTTGIMDVKLIIKYRSTDNVTTMMAGAAGADKRIVYCDDDLADMATLYAQADCVVLPSRSEGWGMPHREAAMMGLPVITQCYSGMDDGFTEKWALVVEAGEMLPIPRQKRIYVGEWRVVDIDELATAMRGCYTLPQVAHGFGQRAAAWLRGNQTWDHAAIAFLRLVESMTMPVENALAIQQGG